MSDATARQNKSFKMLKYPWPKMRWTLIGAKMKVKQDVHGSGACVCGWAPSAKPRPLRICP